MYEIRLFLIFGSFFFKWLYPLEFPADCANVEESFADTSSFCTRAFRVKIVRKNAENFLTEFLSCF